MTYTKTSWVNGVAPAIDATNLNHIEGGIYDAHEMATGRGATFIVAANDSSALVKQQADYVCSGTGDESEINTALGSGSRKVVMMPGNYNVDRSDDTGYFAIGVPSNTELCLLKGAIITLANSQNCGLISNANPTTSNTNILIHGGKIDGNKANQSDYLAFSDPLADKTGHGIQLRGCSNSRISGINIINTYQHSIMAWNGSDNVGIDHCIIDNPGTLGSAYATVSAICVFSNSDNVSIHDNFLNHPDAHGSQQSGCRGIYPSNPIINCNVHNNIITGFRVGINYMVSDACRNGQIVNNTISDAAQGIVTESGGTMGYGFVINGNTVSATDIGLYIRHLTYSQIANNTLVREANYMTGMAVKYSDLIDISGNVIKAGHITPSASIAITDVDDFSMIGNLCSSHFTIDATSSLPEVLNNTFNSGTSTTAVAGIFRNNRGFVTENSGNATLASGTTSIAVAHGLGVTPATGDINVTPIEAWGNMTQFYIDTYTSTQFTIHADQNPGQDVDFAWTAVVL